MARLKKEVIQAVSDNELFRFVDVGGQSFLGSVFASYFTIDKDGTVKQYANKPELVNGKWQPDLDIYVVGYVAAPDEPMIVTTDG